ncbi:MAG TPA: hypothetical protein VH044_07975 [Polyangiaceae bacterium]|jgi:hypothetical protein|nr:hypothetical protein [Polyangiaceae bacterium]
MQWKFVHPLKQPCSGQSNTGSMQSFVMHMPPSSLAGGGPASGSVNGGNPMGGAEPESSPDEPDEGDVASSPVGAVEPSSPVVASSPDPEFEEPEFEEPELDDPDEVSSEDVSPEDDEPDDDEPDDEEPEENGTSVPPVLLAHPASAVMPAAPSASDQRIQEIAALSRTSRSTREG